MIKTIVVDDEPLALELVANYVRRLSFLELVAECSNAQDAFEAISQKGAELVFLDIQMPGMSGLSLTKLLQQKNNVKVVFTTAFPDYALEGFKLDAVDYLLKPFDFEEFEKSANKAKRLIELEQLDKEPEPNWFFVKSEYKLIRIERDKIRYIEGLKDYIKIHLTDEPKPVLTLCSLKEMTEKLPEPQFVRVHKSFIINVSSMVGIERNIIHLNSGDNVPLGDGYRAHFNEIILKK